MMYRIASYNINGLCSAEQKGLWDWCEKQDIDILCLQETRGHSPSSMLKWQYFGWDSVLKGAHGVGILSKKKHFIPCYPQIDHPDIDIRGTILGGDFGSFFVWSIYAPRQTHLNESHHAMFWQYLISLTETWLQVPTIICGDFNLFYSESDIHPNLLQTRKDSLQIGKMYLGKLFQQGWTDVWRSQHPTTQKYSFFSYRNAGMYEQNKGIRLDFQLINPSFRSKILQSKIDRQARFSDHQPILSDFDCNF
jgi:exodeoxyribonuclease III